MSRWRCSSSRPSRTASRSGRAWPGATAATSSPGRSRGPSSAAFPTSSCSGPTRATRSSSTSTASRSRRRCARGGSSSWRPPRPPCSRRRRPRSSPSSATPSASATSAQEADLELRALLQHPEHRDRLALRAHRRVLDDHRYEHRVATVLETVGMATAPRDTSVSAVVPSMRPEQVGHVLDDLAAQSHPRVELVLVTHGFEVDEHDLRARARALGLDDVVVVTAAPGVDPRPVHERRGRGGVRPLRRQDGRRQPLRRALPRRPRARLRLLGGECRRQVGALRAPQLDRRQPAALPRRRAPLRRPRAGRHRSSRRASSPGRCASRTSRAGSTRPSSRRCAERVAGSTRPTGSTSSRCGRRSPDGHTWPVSDLELLSRRGSLVFYGDPVPHVTV